MAKKDSKTSARVLERARRALPSSPEDVVASEALAILPRTPTESLGTQVRLQLATHRPPTSDPRAAGVIEALPDTPEG
jgi:hypothetical protein